MKISRILLLSVAGLYSCSLPPINIYHVSTGYFITDKNAEPFLDKKIELYVTDPQPTLENPITEEKK